MMRVVRAMGCLVVAIAMVVMIFALIVVLSGGSTPPGEPPAFTDRDRIIWGVVGLVALVGSIFLYRWIQRGEEIDAAKRGERPGPTPGTRDRTYDGAYDDATNAFERDAQRLAPAGYRVIGTSWEPLWKRFWLLAAVLWALEFLASARYLWLGWMNFGSGNGRLHAVYHVTSTEADAHASLDSTLQRLRGSPPQ